MPKFERFVSDNRGNQPFALRTVWVSVMAIYQHPKCAVYERHVQRPFHEVSIRMVERLVGEPKEPSLAFRRFR